MRMPSAAMATPPFSSVRKPSTSAVGQAERLARVRFLTWPCSRKLSRNRMAGGEPRLGTDSIYMGHLIVRHHHFYKHNLSLYMATYLTQKSRRACRNLWVLRPQMKKLRTRPPGAASPSRNP